MHTETPTLAHAAPQSTEFVDTIFGALGIDDTYLGEHESNENLSNPKEEPQEMPWVLHVDDDRDLSAALGTRLEVHGIKVVRAFNGTEGVRTALSHPASAILLDYEMPNGQGDYVLGRLKSNPITCDIPVIMLTGRKDRFLERKLLGLGAAKFMNKPVDFNELHTELKRHIGKPVA